MMNNDQENFRNLRKPSSVALERSHRKFLRSTGDMANKLAAVHIRGSAMSLLPRLAGGNVL
jgi:hypothetical protein